MPVVTEHVREACIEYLRLRPQTGTRKAAAHVLHRYGVTARELSEALADEGLLLIQNGSGVDDALPED